MDMMLLAKGGTMRLLRLNSEGQVLAADEAVQPG
jgi:hypothetical protein